MNKKISTRTGIITSFLILTFSFFLVKMNSGTNSLYNLIQFGILFLGIFVSCGLLFRYYAGISFMDAFIHCMKTVATILVIVILGNTLMFFILSGKNEPISNLTFMIMKTIFAYSVSGVLSSLFSSFIFNTFTKK